jgi:putative FmdB family regulatory protein
MPLYEYRCDRCGAEFEELVAARAADAVTCRRCNSVRVTRLLSAFAVGGTALATGALEPGGCGACGAPRRGMCGDA